MFPQDQSFRAQYTPRQVTSSAIDGHAAIPQLGDIALEETEQRGGGRPGCWVSRTCERHRRASVRSRDARAGRSARSRSDGVPTCLLIDSWLALGTLTAMSWQDAVRGAVAGRARLRWHCQSERGSEMPEVPDVSAIAQQVRARIKQIEQQLRQHETLTNELERLRDALTRLEGAARSRVRGDRPPEAKPAERPKRTSTKRASSQGRAPRGQNKAKVLEALKAGPMTASEIAKVTGIGTGTVSTLLTKMAKSGELVKAERGYKLP